MHWKFKTRGVALLAFFVFIGNCSAQSASNGTTVASVVTAASNNSTTSTLGNSTETSSSAPTLPPIGETDYAESELDPFLPLDGNLTTLAPTNETLANVTTVSPLLINGSNLSNISANATTRAIFNVTTTIASIVATVTPVNDDDVLTDKVMKQYFLAILIIVIFILFFVFLIFIVVLVKGGNSPPPSNEQDRDRSFGETRGESSGRPPSPLRGHHITTVPVTSMPQQSTPRAPERASSPPAISNPQPILSPPEPPIRASKRDSVMYPPSPPLPPPPTAVRQEFPMTQLGRDVPVTREEPGMDDDDDNFADRVSSTNSEYDSDAAVNEARIEGRVPAVTTRSAQGYKPNPETADV